MILHFVGQSGLFSSHNLITKSHCFSSTIICRRWRRSHPYQSKNAFGFRLWQVTDFEVICSFNHIIYLAPVAFISLRIFWCSDATKSFGRAHSISEAMQWATMDLVFHSGKIWFVWISAFCIYQIRNDWIFVNYHLLAKCQYKDVKNDQWGRSHFNWTLDNKLSHPTHRLLPIHEIPLLKTAAPRLAHRR